MQPHLDRVSILKRDGSARAFIRRRLRSLSVALPHRGSSILPSVAGPPYSWRVDGGPPGFGRSAQRAPYLHSVRDCGSPEAVLALSRIACGLHGLGLGPAGSLDERPAQSEYGARRAANSPW